MRKCIYICTYACICVNVLMYMYVHVCTCQRPAGQTNCDKIALFRCFFVPAAFACSRARTEICQSISLFRCFFVRARICAHTRAH